MNNKFKIGDVVTLKDGSNKTVNVHAISDNVITCDYFDEDLNAHRLDIPLELLELCES